MELCLVLLVWIVNTGGGVKQSSVLESVHSHPSHLTPSKLAFVEISFAPGKLSKSMKVSVLELSLILPALGKPSFNKTPACVKLVKHLRKGHSSLPVWLAVPPLTLVCHHVSLVELTNSVSVWLPVAEGAVVFFGDL